MGYACLAFNRRGHDILGIRDSRDAEGAAFQTYAEAIEDNRIATAWLAALQSLGTSGAQRKRADFALHQQR